MTKIKQNMIPTNENETNKVGYKWRDMGAYIRKDVTGQWKPHTPEYITMSIKSSSYPRLSNLELNANQIESKVKKGGGTLGYNFENRGKSQIVWYGPFLRLLHFGSITGDYTMLIGLLHQLAPSELIRDALSKGASIINHVDGDGDGDGDDDKNEHGNGGRVLKQNEAFDSGRIIQKDTITTSTEQTNLMVPAVLYPVTPDMDIYHEEQFGPIVPVAEYDQDDLHQVLQFGLEGKYGQQVAIFTSSSSSSSNKEAAHLIDQFSAIYGRININSQCGRSPDTVPFSARRSSGMGVMSVTDALREFSVPTVVAYKEDGKGVQENLMGEIEKESKFMTPSSTSLLSSS